MSRIRVPKSKSSDPTEMSTLLLHRLRAGRAIPVVSNQLLLDLLLGYELDGDQFADYLGYTSLRKDNHPVMVEHVLTLHRMATLDQLTANEDYLEFIKAIMLAQARQANEQHEQVTALAEQMEEVTATQLAVALGLAETRELKATLLNILASLPVPLYLTTSPYCLIEDALRRMGKDPHTQVCNWYNEPSTMTELDPAQNDEPTVERPLVFHLLGWDEKPASLVLTIDDHLDLLARIGADTSYQLIPTHLRRHLANSSLLLLGYQFDSWECKSLLYGVIDERVQHLSSIAVMPLVDQARGAIETAWTQKWNIEIYWGSPDEYMRNLTQTDVA